MKLAQMESAAREIIRATAPLVGGRTINIMDVSGVIIASSDSARIGTFHQGAAEVLEKRVPVRIYASDLPRYPGSREGVNLPILQDGKLLGVVGILGNPDEVEDAANLLGVYVGLFLEQAAASQRAALRREMCLGLLRMLVTPGTAAEQSAEAVRSLSMKLEFPLRVAALTVREPDVLRRARQLDRLEEFLAARGLLNPEQELYGVLDDSLLLLKHTPAGFRADQFLRNLYDTAVSGLGISLSCAIGAPAARWEELPASRREAGSLAAMNRAGTADALESEGRTLCLLGSIGYEETERLLAPLFHAAKNGCGDWLIPTLEAYCACDFSVTRAARELHIHKNTLLYRVKKILTMIGLEEEQGFHKTCFLKLLLLYGRRNNS